ncbi:MAG: CDP-alcohol phosphatidyltransferase family protein [Gammaproteobacteria bacterium]|nr:CDP-alcohol phosphatidyltransferase family protein [Gammaproteobacteria bacterium]
MANLITLSRLFLLLMVILVAYWGAGWWLFATVPLLILCFVTDGLDGYVARKRNETSLLGANLDIAADRILEISLWIVLADLDRVAVWVPLLFIVRGTLVDTIRASRSGASGAAPFETLTSSIGRFLVAGRFMRVLYAVVKALVFCWLLLIHPLPLVVPEFWAGASGWMLGVGDLLIWAAVLLCLARGVPVVVEFCWSQLVSGRSRMSDEAGTV